MATRSSQTDLFTPSEPASAPLPPLETGDVLTRAEFERRYEAMPWLKKAELIDGVVYVGSAVYDRHAVAHANLMVLLGTYAARTAGVQCCDNATVRLDLENEVQPDALLRLAAGGQSRVNKYIEGPPELVAEVASSSVSRDMHSKLAVYRRHGVREYVVWRVLDAVIDWFRLDEADYQHLDADERGIVRGREFPGLWLNVPALLQGDVAAALATLNDGLTSPEHAEFLARRGAAG
jgi:Uma2 family endonuclease